MRRGPWGKGNVEERVYSAENIGWYVEDKRPVESEPEYFVRVIQVDTSRLHSCFTLDGVYLDNPVVQRWPRYRGRVGHGIESTRRCL